MIKEEKSVEELLRDAKIKALIERIEKGEQHLSFSALKSFAESPKSFVEYKVDPKEETDAMFLGTLFHCMILKPDEFEAKYFYFDDSKKVQELVNGGAKTARATKEYKDWKEAKMQEAGDKIIVEPQVYMKAKKMVAALWNNNVSARYLNRMTSTEIELDWEYEGIKFKSYVDGSELEKENGFNLDLKSTPDALPRKFQRAAFDMRYYMQGAMYNYAMNQIKGTPLNAPFYFLAVDQSGHVSVNKMTEDMLRYGREQFDKYVKAFNVCTMKNQWHMDYEFYSELNGIFMFDRPAWAY